jgi:hypothetical protein
LIHGEPPGASLDNMEMGDRAGEAEAPRRPRSLPVFCLSVLLSIVASYVLAWCHEEILVQLAVNFDGITLMVATAALLMWYKTASSRW